MRASAGGWVDQVAIPGFVQKVIHQLLLSIGHVVVPRDNTQTCCALVQLTPTAADSHKRESRKGQGPQVPRGPAEAVHEGAGRPVSPWELQMTFKTELSFLSHAIPLPPPLPLSNKWHPTLYTSGTKLGISS